MDDGSTRSGVHMNRTDLQDQITGLIIDQLEQGTVPWHKGWRVSGVQHSNLISKKSYRGINALILSIVGSEYSSPYWLTYKQASDLGGSVRKGEKGTHITYYAKIAKKAKEDQDPKEVKGSFALLRDYVVFNTDQCDGITVPEIIKDEPVLALDAIDQLLDGEVWNCPEVRYVGQDRAYYSPSADQITLPLVEQFESPQEHAYTLAHELTHSTGHESRCNRWSNPEDKPSRFGCESYAKEELVAEIGACMLLTMIGVEVDIKNSGAYIKSWLGALKDDRTLLFSASAKANQACTLIMGEVKEEVSA